MISNTIIKSTTIKLLEEAFYKYFSKPKIETRHIILDRFFPTERRVSSAMSGLQTSLGSFWEKLAIKLAVENGFSILDNSIIKRPKIEPLELSNLIASTKTIRENSGGDLIDFRDTLNALYSLPYNGNDEFIAIQKGKGSDIILSKNNLIHIFDTKTVQVNSNNGNTFNESILLWLAYYKYKYRIDAHNIHVKFVFPYNSSNENDDTTWWHDYGSRVIPLTNNEVYVGNEFWSFLTDNPTALENIIAGINELSSDLNFIALYKEVFSCTNIDELKEFSIKVKVKRAEKIRNISLTSEENITARHALKWIHGDCEFKSRIGKLIEEGAFSCPKCGCELSY